MSHKVRIAIIGAGAVSDYHHVPGIRIDPRAELVAACDPNEELLGKRLRQWGPIRTTTSSEQIAADPDVDAVIIATPNDTHRPIALACMAGRQARDVREAAGPQLRRSAADVPGRPRAQRAAHDGLHVPFRPVDAVSQALDRFGAARHAAALPQPAVSRPSRNKLGLAAVQGSAPGPATCST